MTAGSGKPGGTSSGEVRFAGNVPEEIRMAMGADPTEEQWRAMSMPLEPYVVVAGAGSGKTSVIAARVVYLALVATGRLDAGPSGGPGVMPGNVLCLTFTIKATENLTGMIRRALAGLALPDGEEPTVLNYHAFAAQVLDRHGLLAGIDAGQRVLSAAQRVELCGRVLDLVEFEHVRAEWQPTLVESILALDDQMANHRRTPEEVIEFNQIRLEELSRWRTDQAYLSSLQRIELARAVARFRELKRELGVIDFGDQITGALRVLDTNPEVAAAYRSRYQTVILDEYQDTNVAQADLLAAAFGEGYPLTAVGDPDQNIYGWRGASLFNLLQFQERFQRADGSPAGKLPLFTNFRSGARILEAADQVIRDIPAEQRPDPDKRLVPFEANGDGGVELARLPDEWVEATWIASRIAALHQEDPPGRPWASFAVLCRKSRLLVPLQEALAERDVPAEIVGLAGLLTVPEVSEVLAYARAVADPQAGVSLARILLGPRYRVGFKDLARVGAWARDRNYGLREVDPDEETPAFLFSEAVEHLGEVTFLSDEGRARLEEFARELEALQREARRPVAEFLAEIVRRIGLSAELDASTDRERAQASRRNLAAFLDEVNAFTPVEGELTLRALLDYLETVQSSTDRQEWSPVQPSSEDSVKVMTIHQAKGLEFDHVFVPGVAEGILPDLTIQQNPVERGKSLDFELRGDQSILPSFEKVGKVLARYKEALKLQEAWAERRTLYVALTRARRRLFVTAAHWYGDAVQKPKKPSELFDELADWGESSGRAEVDRGPEAATENPLTGYREQFVRDWPGPATPSDGDELFPEGWRLAAVRAAAGETSAAERAASLQPETLAAYSGDSARLQAVAAHLAERERVTASPPILPPSVAVNGVIEYLRCPKRFYWSSVRPLPRFSGPAARIGTQVHAWIERKSSGQGTLLELDEPPDLTAEDLAGEPGRVERLQSTFLASRFAASPPLYAERPFLLSLGGFALGGRIDAVFGTPEGPWEIVDYKTGRRPPADDPTSWLQLDVYALACTEVWGKRAEDLTLTYFYLASGEEVSRQAAPVAETRPRVQRALAGIAAREFTPVPGEGCRWCDFLSFCEPGRRYMESRKEPAGEVRAEATDGGSPRA